MGKKHILNANSVHTLTFWASVTHFGPHMWHVCVCVSVAFLIMSNILPKKSWHVWKPENVERVLKDEAAQRAKDEALAAAELEGNRASRINRLRG